MKKIAVILSGCGVYDGSEIHEATLTLLAIAKNKAQYSCFAPDIEQHHVINHTNGEEMTESRNVLIESARIARGNILPLTELSVNDFDAIVFPGGFGVAKNLSDFAFKGADCSVHQQIAEVIQSFHQAKKPIGALCISPAIIAQVIKGASVTIGSDKATISAIELMGGNHKITTHGEIIYDETNKILTTPCYMLDATIVQIETGANKLIGKLINIC
ncbi:MULTISPECIES: isoprenoid biosynthesis glyoxalase ElbB [unclassified Saccharicrinis]|uniref:isoprenoid biosynthesis glyoxalase ElbB n=1 Tax=unclassified Saccharicrinis TaxID=2646859 RepID=UPI003D33758E